MKFLLGRCHCYIPGYQQLIRLEPIHGDIGWYNRDRQPIIGFVRCPTCPVWLNLGRRRCPRKDWQLHHARQLAGLQAFLDEEPKVPGGHLRSHW